MREWYSVVVADKFEPEAEKSNELNPGNENEQVQEKSDCTKTTKRKSKQKNDNDKKKKEVNNDHDLCFLMHLGTLKSKHLTFQTLFFV